MFGSFMDSKSTQNQIIFGGKNEKKAAEFSNQP